MYRSQELFSTLPNAEIAASLSVCCLDQKDEYTGDEADRFRECCALREQGKSYDEISQLLQQNAISTAQEQPIELELQPKSKKSKNGKKSTTKDLSISELLSLASEQCNADLSVGEAIQILQKCGLPIDRERYTDSECDRFLEACDLLKKQGKSYEEVASHFVKSVSQNESARGNLQQDLTITPEDKLVLLVDKTTSAQAERILGIVNYSYLSNALRSLKENQVKIELLFAELEHWLMDQV